MKLKESLRRFALTIGITANPREVAMSINRQNLILGLPVIVIDLVFAIWHLIDLIQNHQIVDARGYRALTCQIVIFVGAILFVIAFIRHTLQARVPHLEPLFTFLINLFIFAHMIWSFDGFTWYYSKVDTFTLYYLSVTLGMVYLAIKPVIAVPFMVAWTYDIIHWFMNHPEYEYSMPFFISMMTVLAVVSFIRYAMTYQMYAKDIEINDIKAQLGACQGKDPLTGLYNRYSIEDKAKKEMNGNVFVMVVDVDNFKAINDTYGHSFGDQAILAYAQTLEGFFGHENLFRYGGDEFLVVTEFEPSDFDLRIRQVDSILQGMTIPNTQIRITGSAGFVVGEYKKPEDLQNLIVFADRYLYQAKNTQKGRALGSSGLIRSRPKADIKEVPLN